MVDIMGVYKSLNVSIGTVMKILKMLKSVLDHLKIKKYVSMQFKNYHIYQDITLVNIRLNRYVIKQF